MLSFIMYLSTAVYWNDPRIHTFGNIGSSGALHASMSPLFTKMLDTVAYNGINLREELHSLIDETDRVVDFGCGTGLSTPFKNGIIGIDTSNEMLSVARTINTYATFVQGNAESWGDTQMADTVIVSFVFHEVPKKGRIRILENAQRIAKKAVYVMDISPEYTPSKSMLIGEPFVIEYMRNIQSEMDMYGFVRTDIVPTRACLWSLRFS